MNPEIQYRELCAEVRSTDDVSFRLLAALLFLTGAAIAAILLGQDSLGLEAAYLLAAAGATLSLGLLRWELRNLQICTQAIQSVQHLEHLLASRQEKPREPPPAIQLYPPLPAPTLLGIPIGKSRAVRLIYTCAITLWLLLPLMLAPLTPRLAGPEPATNQALTVAYLLIATLLALLTTASILTRSPKQERSEH